MTFDAPAAGARLRDVRNGPTVLPSLTLSTFAVVDAGTEGIVVRTAGVGSWTAPPIEGAPARG